MSEDDSHPTITLCKSYIFKKSFVAAALSGLLSAVLRYTEELSAGGYLKQNVPDPVVFNVFIVFASLVAGFRTANALVRYTEAASLLHKQSACWFDVASTLIAFCRITKGSPADVAAFQNTLLRLVSLMSALCLEHLERKASLFDDGHKFEVVGWSELSENTKSALALSHCKVEHVFQTIQQLVVDGMKNDLLTIAPPILTRSFQEMGSGLLYFHEAKKLSCVPLPYAYRFLTTLILCSEAAFIPFILAMHAKGWISACLYSFAGTFLVWFLNGAADVLENPFRKEARTLDPSAVHNELNIQLRELMRLGTQATPSLNRFGSLTTDTLKLDHAASIGAVQRRLTVRRPNSGSGGSRNLDEGFGELSSRSGSFSRLLGLNKRAPNQTQASTDSANSASAAASNASGKLPSADPWPPEDTRGRVSFVENVRRGTGEDEDVFDCGGTDGDSTSRRDPTEDTEESEEQESQLAPASPWPSRSRGAAAFLPHGRGPQQAADADLSLTANGGMDRDTGGPELEELVTIRA